MKISGILLLDKDSGISSNTALHKARVMLGAKKAGHAGTLDPLATGVLPLAFGEATKTCTYMLDADKAYETTAKLGIRTDTADADGQAIEHCALPQLDSSVIEEVLGRFRGEISQCPPMYSALKFQGKALYELAREGIEVERAIRKVQIHQLELLDFGADFLRLKIVCGTGTYVRTLVEDIASALGTCAHVAALRRLWVAPFEHWPCYTLDQLGSMLPSERRTLLAPVDAGIVHLPILNISAERAEQFLQARRFQVFDPPGIYRVYGENKGLIAVGEVLEDGRLSVVRMLAEVVQIPNPDRKRREREDGSGMG